MFLVSATELAFPSSDIPSVRLTGDGREIVRAPQEVLYALFMSGQQSRNDVATTQLAGAHESDLLRRLGAGEVTLSEYLDHQADQGVVHLRGWLDSEQLRAVRETIREQLATDPVMIEMIAALLRRQDAVLRR